MKNFAIAAVTGVFVGLVVFVLCWIIGGIPHVEVLRTYAWAFGLLAGVLTFAKKWDWSLLQ